MENAPLSFPFHWQSDFHLIGLVLFFALIPFVLILMTSFTRITIILTFLRQALNTSVPSNQIIVGLSLILTAFVMHPVIKEIGKEVTPYFQEGKEEVPAQEVVAKAWPPLRHFMLFHTREKDLELFLSLSDLPPPADLAAIPWYCIIPGFVLSELRIAFMMGFLLFLPFLVIDMVVTSLLMSMGMVMLPPVVISFPFKLLLFVLVDGWHLVVQQLVRGYVT